jgi:hypothetical protein
MFVKCLLQPINVAYARTRFKVNLLTVNEKNPNVVAVIFYSITEYF